MRARAGPRLRRGAAITPHKVLGHLAAAGYSGGRGRTGTVDAGGGAVLDTIGSIPEHRDLWLGWLTAAPGSSQARTSSFPSDSGAAVPLPRTGKRSGLWKQREMLTVFVFDKRESSREEDLRAALDVLAEDALLWLALRDPTEEEVAAVQEVFELSDVQAHRLLEQPSRASLVDAGEHLHVTLYVASGEGGEPVLRPVECVLGPNWVVTAHEAEIEVLEEFRERAEGGGQIGALDSPSFVAAVVEWVVTSYFRAFEEVESELEELDAKVMSDVPKNVPDELARLVELRRSIGTLRRALAPHREVIVALAHPELDLLSTETSAERFAALESRVTQAVEAAREAKESTRGSFDLLVARIGQRTNDIMKLLTLVTVILLPASVLAGVMGMNFQVGLFDLAWMFWTVIAVMLGIAVLVLSIARNRSWI
jgi:magnesium transporter